MKSFAIVSLLFVTLIIVPPFLAHGQLDALVDAAKSGSLLGGPFGGPIALIRPCYNFSAFQVIVGPPVGGSFIYQTGASFSYLNGPPYRVAQWLLGMILGTSICDIDPGKIFNGQKGDLLRFHGSSF
ncbi:MAG: hypothetical protein Q8Q36_02210 [bacterium]|nr:hypothetical protein [bacterium]